MSSKALVAIVMYLLGELVVVGTTKIWKTKLVDVKDLDKKGQTFWSNLMYMSLKFC